MNIFSALPFAADSHHDYLREIQQRDKHRARLAQLDELERITIRERENAQLLLWRIQDERELIETELTQLEA